MTMAEDVLSAIRFARSYASKGLETFPFDVVYRATIDQLDAVNQSFAASGSLATFKGTGVDLGLMAAKELGNEEQDFAHALHVIQRYIEETSSS